MARAKQSIRLKDRTFAYYKDGEYICEAPFEELVEITGYAVETLRWMAAPTGSRRRLNVALVEVIDTDTFLCTLSLKSAILKKLKEFEIYTVEDLIKHSPEFLEWVIKNKQQIKTIMMYYKHYKEGVEEYESFNNPTTMGDINRAG